MDAKKVRLIILWIVSVASLLISLIMGFLGFVGESKHYWFDAFPFLITSVIICILASVYFLFRQTVIKNNVYHPLIFLIYLVPLLYYCSIVLYAISFKNCFFQIVGIITLMHADMLHNKSLKVNPSAKVSKSQRIAELEKKVAELEKDKEE